MEEIGAEPERAVYALSVAVEMLQSAEENATKSSFEDSLMQSRDSMRIASSAILFRDGFIAPDLESSCSYLKKKYGDALPLDEWKEVERIARTTLLDRITGFLGIGKGRVESNAKKALDSAFRFINASNALILE